MTISAAWIRGAGDSEELIFVSDSRLSGDGNNFDSCPKIFSLPRNDCVISFAGYTGHAYPMMMQLVSAIESHPRSLDGAVLLSVLKGHMLRIFNSMAKDINPSSFVVGESSDDPEATFLFGGWSWKRKRFQLWSIAFDSTNGGFSAHPAQWLTYLPEASRIIHRKRKNDQGENNIGHFAFAGDQAPLARELFLDKLNLRKEHEREKPLDWEPFEIIRDMLRDNAKSETIGGAPQVVKVYQYMHSSTFAVYWPNKTEGSMFLQGRACLDYEKPNRWVMDPDTCVTEPCQIQHV